MSESLLARPPRPPVVYLLWAGLWAAACSPDTLPPGANGADTDPTEIRSGPIDALLDDPRSVDPEPIWITERPSTNVDDHWFGIGDLVLLEGWLAVLHQSVPEIVFLSRDGTPLGRSAGRGDGPGELSRTRRMISCSDSTVAAVQGRRLHLFGPEGFQGTRPLETPPYAILAYSPDCTRLLVAGEWTLPPEGRLGTATVEVLLAPGDGEADGEATGEAASYAAGIDEQNDTGASEAVEPASPLFLDSIPGALFTRRPDNGAGSTWLSPLAQRTLAAFVGDSILHVLGERSEVRWYGPGGDLVRSASWEQSPQRLDAGVRSHYESKRASVRNDGATAEEIDFMLPEWSSWAGQGSSFPCCSAVLVGADRTIWIRVHRGDLGEAESYRPIAPAPDEEWIVLDAEGRVVDVVAMPPGFDLGAVGTNDLLGVHRDEMEIETVRAYRRR